ncbi:MAG: anthranilate synthase component I, partial [Nitrospirales bacterium]|nr:anthranilate synthase component I [Nitrospirales bacterium]
MNIKLDEFSELSKRGNLIPLYKEILGDIDTPVSAFLKLKKRPSFLLESVVGGEKWARYSFIGLDPSLTITCRGIDLEIQNGEKRSMISENPLEVIRDTMKKFRPVEVKGLPRFSGGLVGYMGYDVVKSFERVPDLGKPGLDMPDIFLMLTDTILVFDNLRQTIKVAYNVHTEGQDLEEAYSKAEARIDRVIAELRNGQVEQRGDWECQGLTSPAPASSSEFTSNFTKEGFMNAVVKAKEYIYAGDIVQVVPSQRFERKTDVPSFDIYRALRVINPSPDMYFLDTGDAQLVGSSPEILVRLEGDTVTLRPIAGTRKRGETEQEDRALEEELLKDPKEIAEHIMLVDLGRNDVGRVAEIGSVRVT